MKSPEWTNREVEKLDDLWPRATLDEIKRVLPRRTHHAIAAKAKERNLYRPKGVPRSRYTTPDEADFLRRLNRCIYQTERRIVKLKARLVTMKKERTRLAELSKGRERKGSNMKPGIQQGRPLGAGVPPNWDLIPYTGKDVGELTLDT